MTNVKSLLVRLLRAVVTIEVEEFAWLGLLYGLHKVVKPQHPAAAQRPAGLGLGHCQPTALAVVLDGQEVQEDI
eukprot:11213594-Lingulodinium_polyedra.AAC.1